MGGDAGAGVDGDAGDLAVDEFALSGVQAGANVEAEFADGVCDGAGAADCAGWPIEACEEPVTRRVDLDASVAQQLSAHEFVMPLQQLSPAPVAESCRVFA